MKIKKLSSVLLAAVLAISMVGCGNKSASSDEKTITACMEAEPESLDQAKGSDWCSFIVENQYTEGLTSVIVKDGVDTVEPGIAEKWETSEDQLKWTFHLRDAKWSDGEPVKAQDFVFGMKRILDPNNASPLSANINFIKNGEAVLAGEKSVDELGIKAIDDKTLEIQLDRPVPYLLEIAASAPMQPVREDKVKEFGETYGTEADKAIGCGPFVIDEWEHNSKISFSKNPEYWNAENVKIDKLDIKIIEDTATAVESFENGELDYVSVYDAEWIQKLSEGDYNVIEKQPSETKYMFFNQKEKLFSNAKVRKAFSVALNREEIEKDLTKGLDKSAFGWVAPCVMIGEENYREVSPEPVEELIKENPDAKKLLSEGLKELGMDSDPSKLTISLMCPDYEKTFAEYAQQSLKETLGVNIEIDAAEWTVFQERNRGLDYQFGIKSYMALYNDPSSVMNLWFSDNNTVPIGWGSEEYDKLVKEANASIDTELRKSNFQKAEKILLYDEAAIAPYSFVASKNFTQKNVTNVMDPVYSAVQFKYAEKN